MGADSRTSPILLRRSRQVSNGVVGLVKFLPLPGEQAANDDSGGFCCQVPPNPA